MRLVMKFGGTSIGDGVRMKHVAELAKKYRDEGMRLFLYLNRTAIPYYTLQ